MGTNFYWNLHTPAGDPVGVSDEPTIHIGKRSFHGKQRGHPESGLTFTWAQDDVVVIGALNLLAKEHPEDRVVVDEYGKTFTAAEFLVEIEHTLPNREMIGAHFS